jgi:hypothetical protein
MKRTIGTRVALSLVVAAMLASCGGNSTSIETPATARSWMAPNSSSQDLLYVTGACGGICVFSYPGGTLVGELYDSNSPSAECVDQSGNVFVVNFGGENGTSGIVEYAHGRTKPIATLTDPGYYPQACSIDPTTGNLVVTNDLAKNGDTGGIAIYTGAKGDPTDYVDPKIYYMGFCAYDDKGNLFVDGQYDHEGTFEFDELPKGSGNFKRIKLTQRPSNPFVMQWTGKYIALADSNTVIYHVTVNGSKGTLVGTTLLNGPVSETEVQFWIQGGTIIEPYYALASQPYEVGFWKYPAGGRVRKSLSGEFVDAELFGTVVSLSQR